MNDYLLWGALAGVAGLLVVLFAMRRKPKGFHRAQRVEVAASVQPSTSGPPSIDTVSAAYRMQAPIVDSKSPAPLLPGENARETAETAAREAADREAAEWEAQLLAQHEAQEASQRAEPTRSQASPPAITNAVAESDRTALRLQTEEELQAMMDREAAEFAARIEAERLASEAPTLQPLDAAEELTLQDESTAATAASTAPTLTDVVAEPTSKPTAELPAAVVASTVDDTPTLASSADDSAAARREAAAQLARERAEREAAEAEAWLDEQRRATEARRAQAALDAANATSEKVGDAVADPAPAAISDIAAAIPTDLPAPTGDFDFQIEVPRLQTEEERYAEVERETANLAARVNAQRLAIDQLGVTPSLGIEPDFTSAVQDAVEVAHADTPPPAEPARLRRTPDQFMVMVADDSKVVRVKTSRLLLKQGYQILLAEDGLDAMRQITERVPDVLITDVEMPGLDGFGLTRQVRADERSAHIPIVMITADDEKHRVAAMSAGVSVLLSKPYPEDRLLSYLEETLGCAVAAAG